MQNINWEMMTQFIFPEEVGIVEEVISVNIIPRWQQIDSDNSVRLVGIYHITATARFNPQELPEYSEGTLIEHLDFDGNNGYFEYALPLEVDLPREKVAVDHHPEMFVENVSYFVYDGSNCTLKWEVRCTFKEPIEGALFTYEATVPKFDQAPVEPVPQLVQEPLSELVHETIPEPVLETTEESVQEPVLETSQESVQEPVLEPTEESVQEPVLETTQESVREPVLETTQESVREPVLETTHETVQEPVLVTTQESIQEPVLVTAQKTVPEPVLVTAQKTVPEPVLDPIVEPLQELKQVAIEKATYNVLESSSSSSSVHMTIDVNYGAVILERNNEENVVEAINELEPVHNLESLTINKYFPTDSDDFFNDLTETYNLLDVSNKVSRK